MFAVSETHTQGDSKTHTQGEDSDVRGQLSIMSGSSRPRLKGVGTLALKPSAWKRSDIGEVEGEVEREVEVGGGRGG